MIVHFPIEQEFPEKVKKLKLFTIAIRTDNKIHDCIIA